MFERDTERKIANRAREWFGVDGNVWIDVVKCITSGKVWTIKGEKRLVLEIISASDAAAKEMCRVDAITISGRDWVLIKVAEQVYKAALAGVERARMTLAHEFGHAVLCHPREALARITGVSRSTPISPAVRKLESEANRFASFFLVKDELAQDCKSPKDISERFGVSGLFAEIWLKGRSEEQARPRIIDGFKKLLEELNRKANSTGVSFTSLSSGSELVARANPDGLPCY